MLKVSILIKGGVFISVHISMKLQPCTASQFKGISSFPVADPVILKRGFLVAHTKFLRPHQQLLFSKGIPQENVLAQYSAVRNLVCNLAKLHTAFSHCVKKPKNE